jgi:hypothetical protein
MEEQIILKQIQKGQQDVKDGKVYSTAQAKLKLAKWLK